MPKKKRNWIIDKILGYPKKILILAGAALVLFAYAAVTIFAGLPSPGKLGSDAFPVSTKIFDRNGQLLYEIYTDQTGRRSL